MLTFLITDCGWKNARHIFFFFFFFDLPELSSERDLVIQMSVPGAPSTVRVYLSGAYLGNRMTYLDDIWYVGGAMSEVAHAEFWAWQMPMCYGYHIWSKEALMQAESDDDLYQACEISDFGITLE